MSDKQKRLVLIITGGVIIICCLVASISSVYLARMVILPRIDGNTNDVSDVPTLEERSLSEQGLLIIAIDPNGPAATAGLKRGDIILRADGTRVDRPQQLQRILQTRGPGATVTFQILDGSETKEVSVTLGARDPSLAIRVLGSSEQVLVPAAPSSRPQGDATPTPASPEPFFPDNLPERPFQFASRAVVAAVVEDSPAAAIGLQVGDVITSINDEAILSSQEVIEAIGKHAPGDRITLVVRRGFDTLSFRVTLDTHPEDPSRGYLGVDLSAVPFAPPNLLATPTD